MKDLVLVGGGHAHALVLRMWGMDPQPGVRLTLVTPGPVAAYTGMLPGLVAGHYRRDEILIDLVRLARFAGADLILAPATGLDLSRRELQVQGRPPLGFDLLSLDIGVGSGLADLPGFAAHGHPVRPLGDFADTWERFVDRNLPEPRIAILGAGLGGVELALAAEWRLRAAGRRPRISLIDRGEALPGLGARTRARLRGELDRAGVTLLTGVQATGAEDGALTLSDGSRHEADLILSAVGGRPQGWLAESGLATEAGFVRMDRHLRASDPAVFAAGDCAHLSADPRPKAGVFAVRQAPVLHHNLRAALSGAPLRPFRPQRDYLKLVSTGGRKAIADKAGLQAGGGWLWRLKDGIDRRFMDRFGDYPAPAPDPAPAGAPPDLARALAERPLCAGCGAKVGPGVLTAALAGLAPPRRADVLAGAGDDAASLRHAAGVQVLTTDHLRAFVDDPWLMGRLAALHALGDIWAMGARPQAALAQITLPRLAEALQQRTLSQVLAAASEVLTEAGADLVGGHTTQGDSLSVGFAVTGLAGRTVTKAGALDGQAILLSRPIGSGTILAAAMAGTRLPGLVLGETLSAALARMSRPLGPAAGLLAPVAGAMTDVTGFGLAGHLMEILRASRLGATLDLSAVPFLPGAEALAAAGIGSSLAAANRAAVDWQIDAPPGPRTDLLFDPQTCGGLLATVPSALAPDLTAQLRALGEEAAIIGHVHPGPAHVTAFS